MNFKFKTIIISTLFLSSSLIADNKAENPTPHSATTAFDEDSLRETRKHIQEIHRLESAFDDPSSDGMPLESFNYVLILEDNN